MNVVVTPLMVIAIVQADDILGPVLALLTRLAVRRHGQSAVVAR